MEYYDLITPPADDPGTQWTLDLPQAGMPDDWPPFEAGPVEEWNPRIIARASKDLPPTDFPFVYGEWAVCSPRLRALWESLAPGEVQLLPIRIRSVTGANPIEGYCVANLLKRLDCLDRERSATSDGRWEPFNEYGDVDLDKTVLNRQRIGPAKIFAVLGDSILFVVREDVKEAMERKRMTAGCVFERVESV